jgi:hypothetical protein
MRTWLLLASAHKRVRVGPRSQVKDEKSQSSVSASALEILHVFLDSTLPNEADGVIVERVRDRVMPAEPPGACCVSANCNESSA